MRYCAPALRIGDVILIDSEGNQDCLLPGEPHEARYPEDVAHWIAVYAELTQFLNSSGLPLPQTMERYLERLEFWQKRLRDLEPTTVEADAADPGGAPDVSRQVAEQAGP